MLFSIYILQSIYYRRLIYRQNTKQGAGFLSDSIALNENSPGDIRGCLNLYSYYSDSMKLNRQILAEIDVGPTSLLLSLPRVAKAVLLGQVDFGFEEIAQPLCRQQFVFRPIGDDAAVLHH